MIQLEKEALAAFMMGGIMLQSPPRFLVCTDPRATRVVMIDFFEAYLEGKVIAIVPPYVRVPQFIAEKTLLLQLLERSEGKMESDVMSRELVKGAKRTSYDADTRRMSSLCRIKWLQRGGMQRRLSFAASVFSCCGLLLWNA